MKDISFVITTYNHSEQLVKRCIDSIYNVMQYCYYFDYDIKLVNNLPDINYSSLKNDKVRIINSSKNLGYCGGNNLGIKNSNSKFIILLNPDVKITNSLAIDWMIGTCKLYNCISGRLIGTNNWYTYSSSFPTDKKYIDIPLPFYFNEPTLIKDGDWKSFKYIDGCLMAFEKQIWEDLEGFDEDIFPGYFGENTFAFKSYLKYNKFILYDSSINNLFEHSDNDSTFNTLSNIITWTKESREKFYSKYALNNWDKFIEYLNF